MSTDFQPDAKAIAQRHLLVLRALVAEESGEARAGRAEDCSHARQARSDLQHATDRLDPVDLAVLADEGTHHFSRRSSSAWAKNALASFRISLALRGSRLSRSNSLMRCASAVMSPRAGRCRTHAGAPSAAASWPCSRSWRRWTRWPPTASRAGPMPPQPSERPAPGRQVKTRLTSSWLHPLILSKVGASPKPGAVQRCQALNHRALTSALRRRVCQQPTLLAPKLLTCPPKRSRAHAHYSAHLSSGCVPQAPTPPRCAAVQLRRYA